MTNFSDDGNDRSMYTANCYLKSQGADFEGGAMRFYIPLESALSEVQRGAGGRHRAVELGHYRPLYPDTHGVSEPVRN